MMCVEGTYNSSLTYPCIDSYHNHGINNIICQMLSTKTYAQTSQFMVSTILLLSRSVLQCFRLQQVQDALKLCPNSTHMHLGYAASPSERALGARPDCRIKPFFLAQRTCIKMSFIMLK